MSKMKEVSDKILSRFAGTGEYDKIRAVLAFCNSHSAFVMWVRKTACSVSVIRAARLIQQAWLRFGRARSILITCRSLKAAMMKALQGQSVEDIRIKMTEALELLEQLCGGGQSRKPAHTVAGGIQQDLFV